MLEEKIKTYKVNAWLINTGWTGGSYGKGQRIELKYTRAMIKAVLDNKIEKFNYERDSPFHFLVPDTCPGIPHQLLNPRASWEDKLSYDNAAKKLKDLFEQNFIHLEKTQGKKPLPVN